MGRTNINRRHWISVLLSASGALVLGYVGYQYASMYMAQQRLEREWQRTEKQPAVSSRLHTVASENLMRLSSPKIGLDLVVVEGSSPEELSQGPGHMQKTVLPGQKGNAVITGHRDTFFRNIGDLAVGDTITIDRDGRSYTYQVTGKRVVDPTDLSVIQPTSDAELTLITCHPTYYLGPAPKRLVIFSKLVGRPDSERLQAKRVGDPPKTLKKTASVE